MHPLRHAVDGVRPCLGLVLLAALGAACTTRAQASPAEGARPAVAESASAAALSVRFLEVVTTEVEATCATLGRQHGVRFGEPVPELGNARVARLAGGGRISVRAPLASHESPVVRPYLLVADIEAAVAEAAAAGAEIAHPPLEIPGQGTFAIYILGGVQHGLWQD